jgi:hypothetical protein
LARDVDYAHRPPDGVGCWGRGTNPQQRERAVPDLTTSLGGPVVRDRLWFFTAYQYLRDYDSQPGADPAFPRKYEQNKFFGKLNWRLAPSLQMMQSFHQERWVNPTPPTLAAPFVTNSACTPVRT